MRLRYTPEAREDVRNVKTYIAQQLRNLSAAERVTANILQCCAQLKAQPYMGLSMAERLGVESDLYYLICGNYIAFYRPEKNNISVIRILDRRTDYMQTLFGRENN